jgi:cis-3-alkyl-4-acyloxetan-2-one decarboxylase
VKIFDRYWHKTLKRPFKLQKTVKTGRGKNVLLIHGLGASGNAWQPLVDIIDKKKWRVSGYDLLGFSKSPKPSYLKYTVNDHTRSLVYSLERNLKNGKFTIIAHSMGCLVASHLAWLYPNMVERLILYEPPLFADSPEFRSHDRRRKLYFALYNQLLQKPRILFTYSKWASRYAQRWALTLDSQTWLPFERSLKNTIMNQRAYDELKMVEVPTDIIYGKFDFVITRTDVKDMLQANKNITFHLVNEMHDINPRAARYILKILNSPHKKPISYTKNSV